MPITHTCPILRWPQNQLSHPEPTVTPTCKPVRTASQTRMSSNYATRFDASLCVICQKSHSHHGKTSSDKLMKVSTEARAASLLEAAKRRQDIVLFQLSVIDMLATGVRYHSSCRGAPEAPEMSPMPPSCMIQMQKRPKMTHGKQHSIIWLRWSMDHCRLGLWRCLTYVPHSTSHLQRWGNLKHSAKELLKHYCENICF